MILKNILEDTRFFKDVKDAQTLESVEAIKTLKNIETLKDAQTLETLKTLESVEAIKKTVSRLEVEMLLAHTLGCDRSYLYTHWDKALSKKQFRKFLSLFKQRRAGRPMAYITGKKEFYGYEFIVEPGVFIPRPETETLVSAVLSQYDSLSALNIMDFGCGSGAVGLSLLKLFPRARLTAIDFSDKALEVSRRNAIKMDLSSRAGFLKKDLLKWNKNDRKIKKIAGKIDLIVANPPYIAFDDSRVQAEVVAFEPACALFSGENGLRHIRAWLNLSAQILKPGGHYFFEIGAEQDMSFLIMKNNVRKQQEFQDMSHITRVIQLQKYYG